MKKCVAKILGFLGFALGIMVALMYTHGASMADKANWTILAYGFIGAAIGIIVSLIVCKACGASCHSGE